MDAATENAKLNGRQGYMYPWESAYTGKGVQEGQWYIDGLVKDNLNHHQYVHWKYEY